MNGKQKKWVHYISKFVFHFTLWLLQESHPAGTVHLLLHTVSTRHYSKEETQPALGGARSPSHTRSAARLLIINTICTETQINGTVVIHPFLLTTNSFFLCLRCSGWRQGGCALKPYLYGEQPAGQQPAQPPCQGGASQGRRREAQNPQGITQSRGWGHGYSGPTFCL